jgi:hypothetical protein
VLASAGGLRQPLATEFYRGIPVCCSIGNRSKSARNGQSCSAQLPRYEFTNAKPAVLGSNPSGHMVHCRPRRLISSGCAAMPVGARSCDYPSRQGRPWTAQRSSPSRSCRTRRPSRAPACSEARPSPTMASGLASPSVRGQGLMSFLVRAHMSVAGQAGSLQGTTPVRRLEAVLQSIAGPVDRDDVAVVQ